ncbi:hypothetical protein WAI453_007371 [Rhynchosporium graminicola]
MLGAKRYVSQIAVYTSAKKKLLANRLMPFSEYVLLHIAASLVAGTVAMCAPADVLQRGYDLLLMFLFMEQLQREGKRPGKQLKHTYSGQSETQMLRDEIGYVRAEEGTCSQG